MAHKTPIAHRHIHIYPMPINSQISPQKKILRVCVKKKVLKVLFCAYNYHFWVPQILHH
jgi:hypothetical protein